jgi:hypothetical protein
MDGTTPDTPAPEKPAAEMSLADHEMASRARYAKLITKLKKLKESKMSTTTPDVNVYSKDPMSGILPMMMGGGGWGGGAGAGAGAGLGAGVVGGLLGGLLFNRNGIGGTGVDGGVVTPSQLQAALNGQTAGQNTTAILQTLAAIQASIPENEGKVQLAIAQAQIALDQHLQANSLSQANHAADIIGNITAGDMNINNNIRANRDTQFANSQALQLAIANLGTMGLQQTYAITQAIQGDGQQTRALIIAQNDTMLNRIITEQANELIELKNDKVAAANGLTITQTVNQAQSQAQQQQQQQQQLILLSQLCTGLANVTQIAHATNSNVIAGNTGAVTTGAQTANPVNVNS